MACMLHVLCGMNGMVWWEHNPSFLNYLSEPSELHRSFFHSTDQNHISTLTISSALSDSSGVNSHHSNLMLVHRTATQLTPHPHYCTLCSAIAACRGSAGCICRGDAGCSIAVYVFTHSHLHPHSLASICMSAHRSALGVASDEDDSDDARLRARQLLSASPSTSASSLSSSSSFVHSPSASSPSPASPDACDEQKVAEMLEELVLSDDVDDMRNQMQPTNTGWRTVPLASSNNTSPTSSSSFARQSSVAVAAAAVSASPPHSSPTSPSSTASSLSAPIRLSHDDYLCPICLSLLVDPLTLPCQHSFCRHCLVACFELSAKRCPQCRASTADNFPPAESLGANTLLVRLLREAWGETYKQREVSVAEVRASWKRKFPIYFSHELIFPYQTLLLNLHEPRYQLMHQRLSASRPADSKRCFAILPRQQTSEGSVGVLCELITETERNRGVGAFTVVTTQRFTVESCWQEDGTHGLHYARVQILNDVDESTVAVAVDTLVQQSVERIHSAIQVYNSICPFPLSFHSRFGSVPSSPHQLSFWLFQSLAVDTAAVSIERGMIASMIESRSLLWRLGVGEELLQQLVSRSLAEHDMIHPSLPQPDVSTQQRVRQQPRAPTDLRVTGRRQRGGRVLTVAETEQASLEVGPLARHLFPSSPVSPEQVFVANPPSFELSPPQLPQSPQQHPQHSPARHTQRQRYRGHQQHNNHGRRYPRPFVYQQQQQQQQQQLQQQSPPLQARPHMPPAHFAALSHDQQHEQAFAQLRPAMPAVQFGAANVQQANITQYMPSETWRMWQLSGEQAEQNARMAHSGHAAPMLGPYSFH